MIKFNPIQSSSSFIIVYSFVEERENKPSIHISKRPYIYIEIYSDNPLFLFRILLF